MTATIAPFAVTPELTQLEARSICEAIHAAEHKGEPSHPMALAPGGNWLSTLETLLASPLGQAALSVIEGFVSRGLLKPAPATSAEPG